MTKLEFDYSNLVERIKEVYGSRSNFADALGQTIQCVSNKLNNRSGFTQEDVVVWSCLLEIDIFHVGEFFYVRKV